MGFLLSYIILAEIYAVAAVSTNLLVGIVGIFSISQAAILGVGAYAVAYLTLQAGMDFFPALLIGMAIGTVLNVLITLPSLRVAGDYFVVTSFGIQLFATAVFSNWTDVTGGATGIAGVPAPLEFGFDFTDPSRYVLLSTAVLVIACVIFWLLMRSPFGRLLRAIREDELAVAAAGKHVLKAKVAVAAVAGAIAAAAGGLYATYISFVDPSSFELYSSILLVTMVVVGGSRTLLGSLVGPFLLLALPQLLTLIDLPSNVVGPARQLIYGALLIAFMVFRPQGIAGEKL